MHSVFYNSTLCIAFIYYFAKQNQKYKKLKKRVTD